MYLVLYPPSKLEFERKERRRRRQNYMKTNHIYSFSISYSRYSVRFSAFHSELPLGTLRHTHIPGPFTFLIKFLLLLFVALFVVAVIMHGFIEMGEHSQKYLYRSRRRQMKVKFDEMYYFIDVEYYAT